MNRKQLNYLAMAKLVYAWLKAHKNDVINHPKLEELYNQLGEFIEAIEAKGSVQKSVVTGITRKKDAGEAQLVELLLQIKDALSAFAVTTSNLELKAIANLSYYSLSQTRDIDLLLIAKNIQAQLNLHLAELEVFNVKPADAATFADALANYEQSLTKPHEAKVSKVAATQSLSGLFAHLKQEILPSIDLMMAPQKRTLPGLYAEYQNARKIINLAAGHAGTKSSPNKAAKQNS